MGPLDLWTQSRDPRTLGPLDLWTLRSSQVFSPVEHQAPTLSNPLESIQERGVRARALREHVAAFRHFFHQNPSHREPRLLECLDPEIAVALVKKVAQRETGMRGVLHVVTERSHAREDW